jgi:hypothetical protein
MGNDKQTGSGGFKIPDQLFTFASFNTLGGCAIIAWIVTSVLCGVFKLSQGPTGLIVSIIVALAAVRVSTERRFEKYIVAVFNGFLIYLTVIGGTSFTPYVNPKTPEEASKPGILKPWIPDNNFVNESARQKRTLEEIRTELGNLQRDITQITILPNQQRNLLLERLNRSRRLIPDSTNHN